MCDVINFISKRVSGVFPPLLLLRTHFVRKSRERTTTHRDASKNIPSSFFSVPRRVRSGEEVKVNVSKSEGTIFIECQPGDCDFLNQVNLYTYKMPTDGSKKTLTTSSFSTRLMNGGCEIITKTLCVLKSFYCY